eukprot:1683238-Pyramimonas_sp.AAC.1
MPLAAPFYALPAWPLAPPTVAPVRAAASAVRPHALAKSVPQPTNTSRHVSPALVNFRVS